MTIETMDFGMVSASIREILESEYLESYGEEKARLQEEFEAEMQAYDEAVEDIVLGHNRDWYNQGATYSDPELFLFVSGEKDRSHRFFAAPSFTIAKQIIESFPGWYGCNMFQLNEYRVKSDGLEFGPKTNFFLNAVEEYYEYLRSA